MGYEWGEREAAQVAATARESLCSDMTSKKYDQYSSALKRAVKLSQRGRGTQVQPQTVHSCIEQIVRPSCVGWQLFDVYDEKVLYYSSEDYPSLPKYPALSLTS